MSDWLAKEVFFPTLGGFFPLPVTFLEVSFFPSTVFWRHLNQKRLEEAFPASSSTGALDFGSACRACSDPGLFWLRAELGSYVHWHPACMKLCFSRPSANLSKSKGCHASLGEIERSSTNIIMISIEGTDTRIELSLKYRKHVWYLLTMRFHFRFFALNSLNPKGTYIKDYKGAFPITTLPARISAFRQPP